MSTAIIAIGAAIAVFTGFGAAIGIGIATKAAVESVARQPEAAGTLRSTMIMGCAIAETTGIYSLIIAFLILFLL